MICSIEFNHYKHFLALHVAIRMLASPQLCMELNSYASELLLYFVTHFGKLYGKENVSYNVHGLIHLSDDVKHFGHLDTFSAFPFENHLQSIKSMLRKSEKPLQQLHNGLYEYQTNL